MANLEARRSVFIDDSYSDVHYSGSWFLDTYDLPGPFQYIGGSAKRTAHGTSTTGGFSFSFEGTSFSVEGQSSVIPATTNSGLLCTVDGMEGSSEVVNPNNLKYWHLCGATDLSFGRHEVVINITAGPNTVFWLDEIYYWSLPNPNLDGKTSMFHANAEELGFSGISWVSPFDEHGILGRETYANGAKVTIKFYGVSLELTSYLTSQMPLTAGSGSYSLNGGPAVRFNISAWTPEFRGLPPNETIHRVSLFTTPPALPGQHVLEVINLGNAGTVPLSIERLFVDHGGVDQTTGTALPAPAVARPVPPQVTTSGSAFTAPSEATVTGTSAINNGSTQKTLVGAVVGGIVGGTAIIIIAGVLIYLYLKRRKESSTARTQALWTEQENLDSLSVPLSGFHRDTGFDGGYDAYSVATGPSSSRASTVWTASSRYSSSYYS